MNPTPQPEEENSIAKAAEEQRKQYWLDRMLHTPLVIPTPQERKELDQIKLTESVVDTLHWSNEAVLNPETMILDMMKYHDQRIKLRIEQAQRTSTTNQHQARESPKPEPEPLSIMPDPAEVEEIDNAIPDEWKQAPAKQPEPDQTIEHLTQMDDSELAKQLDPPSGDIDRNAQQAVKELAPEVQELLSQPVEMPEGEPGRPTQTQDQADDHGR
jgi:hypothetical protein